MIISHLVQSWAKQPGDLLDEGVRAEEGIIALGKLLHLLLVLVQFLQLICRHAGQPLLLGLVTVSLVSQDAHLELVARNVLQPGEQKVRRGRLETETEKEKVENIDRFCKLKFSH